MRQILIEKYIEPSEIRVDGDDICERWFDRNEDLHSFMGQPAYIEYENGQICYQSWYKKGVRHRDGDLPAVINYHSNEKISYQAWCKNGQSGKQIWYNNERK
jgi:hypothetical protein